MSHDWRNHSSSPHHHEGDEPEPVWDAPRAAPTTVDEAREALLAGIVDDESGMETFDDGLVDALIAAVRAENVRSSERYELGLYDGRAESAETLAALREAAATVYEHHTMQANHWDTDQHRCWIVLRDALAATPAEDRTHGGRHDPDAEGASCPLCWAATPAEDELPKLPNGDDVFGLEAF